MKVEDFKSFLDAQIRSTQKFDLQTDEDKSKLELNNQKEVDSIFESISISDDFIKLGLQEQVYSKLASQIENGTINFADLINNKSKINTYVDSCEKAIQKTPEYTKALELYNEMEGIKDTTTTILTVTTIDKMLKNYDELSKNERLSLAGNLRNMTQEQQRKFFQSLGKSFREIATNHPEDAESLNNLSDTIASLGDIPMPPNLNPKKQQQYQDDLKKMLGLSSEEIDAKLEATSKEIVAASDRMQNETDEERKKDATEVVRQTNSIKFLKSSRYIIASDRNLFEQLRQSGSLLPFSRFESSEVEYQDEYATQLSQIAISLDRNDIPKLNESMKNITILVIRMNEGKISKTNPSVYKQAKDTGALLDISGTGNLTLEELSKYGSLISQLEQATSETTELDPESCIQSLISFGKQIKEIHKGDTSKSNFESPKISEDFMPESIFKNILSKESTPEKQPEPSDISVALQEYKKYVKSLDEIDTETMVSLKELSLDDISVQLVSNFDDYIGRNSLDEKKKSLFDTISAVGLSEEMSTSLLDSQERDSFIEKLDTIIEHGIEIDPQIGLEASLSEILKEAMVPPIQDKEADEKLEKMAVEVITTGIDAVEKSQKSNEGQIPSEEVDQAYLNGVDIEVNAAFYRIVTEMQEKLEEGEELDPTEVLKALEEEYGKDELAEKLGITEEKDDDTAGNSSDSDTGKKGYSKDDKTQKGKTATYVQSTIPNMEEKEESTDDKKESSQEEKESTEQHQDEQSHEEQTEPNQGEQQNIFFNGISDMTSMIANYSTTFEAVKQEEENIKKVVISKESNKNQEYNTKNDSDAPKENDTPEDDR